VADFVPGDFEVPLGLETSEFVLRPLGPEHNDRDYDAWTSSMEHILATPGFGDGSWPHEMTRDENRADLQRHADDFSNRTGFTYTVLDPAGSDVIGCVYIYPARGSDAGASVASWVRKSHARLDVTLWRAVNDWLESDWPFANVEYAPRAAARVRTGGCLCGAVRYSVRGDPVHIRCCHCASCRKESGSAFTVYAEWPVEAFELSGTLSSYDGRGFCPRCGSRLVDTSDADGALVEIRLGSLDEAPFELRPDDETWVKRRESWIAPFAGATQHDESL
jgi:hypothetical protein